MLEDNDCRDDKLSVDLALIQALWFPLDIYKSKVPDETHSRVLKELVSVIVGHVSIIFQWSQESGEFLVNWKLTVFQANVSPVFKKGEKEDSGN